MTFKLLFLIVLVLIDNWVLNVIKMDSLKKGALWWDAGANADVTAPARVDIISMLPPSLSGPANHNGLELRRELPACQDRKDEAAQRRRRRRGTGGASGTNLRHQG